MFDYHMHSTVSFDGHASPEDMARAALRAGLQEICFTDHVDDDPKRKLDNCRFSLEAYAAAYDRLKIPALKIRRGMEFGMLEDNQPLLREYLSARPFDYVIGSVHFADDEDVYYPSYWQNRTVLEGERQYLMDMLRCVCAHDEFDVLGHLTYISKASSHPTSWPVDYMAHQEVVDEILRTLVRKGKGIEINTSGLDRCGDFLPGEVYVHRFRELGGEIITVGSDAHDTRRVGQYLDRACAIAKEIFGYVCTFQERKPIFHKL